MNPSLHALFPLYCFISYYNTTNLFCFLESLSKIQENSFFANMAFLICRVILVSIFCIAILSVSVQIGTVSGVRRVDLALLRRRRILSGDALQDLSTTVNVAPSPSPVFDPNESQKRRVRRGADPIHNKYMMHR